MADYTSNIEKIPYNAEKIFSKLSDFTFLKEFESYIPEDKISDLKYDSDTCSFKNSKTGEIKLKIIEKDPFKTIKIATEKSILPFTFWIQLKEIAEDDTRIKLTVRADIPFMFKGMIQKPLKEGLIKLGEALSKIPY